MDCLMRPAVEWCFNVSIVVCRKHHNSPTTIGRHHELGHLHSAFLKTSIHIMAKTMIEGVLKYAPRKIFRYSRGLLEGGSSTSTTNQQDHPPYAKDTKII